MLTMNDNEFFVDNYIADVMAEYSRGFPSVDEYVADVVGGCYPADREQSKQKW